MPGNPGGGRVDSASRLLAAGPEVVYRALTDAEAIAEWRRPDGMSCEVLEYDARPGGRFRMVLGYLDAPGAGKTTADSDAVSGRFLELVECRRVVEEVEFDADDPSFAGRMRVITELAPHRAGTEVTIRCEDVPAGISAADHAAGLAATLENLARYVERRP